MALALVDATPPQSGLSMENCSVIFGLLRCARRGLSYRRRGIRLGLALLATALPATAQEASRLEAYGGYDYVRYNATPRETGVPLSESFNANGASGQIAYSPNAWLSVVGELSGYALARPGLGTTHQVSYLFGPRINVRRGKVTPFVQVLAGRTWLEDGITFGSISVFAMTAGGGIDIGVSRHIAIRPAQAEYFLTALPDGNTDRQNNWRFSAGVVVRFGGR
jgi:opacity protein-like surface antigen